MSFCNSFQCEISIVLKEKSFKMPDLRIHNVWHKTCLFLVIGVVSFVCLNCSLDRNKETLEKSESRLEMRLVFRLGVGFTWWPFATPTISTWNWAIKIHREIFDCLILTRSWEDQSAERRFQQIEGRKEGEMEFWRQKEPEKTQSHLR